MSEFCKLRGLSMDFLTREGWSQCQLGHSRPNQFCECAIVGLSTTFYIVLCDINMTTFDKGQLTLLGYRE